MQGDGHGAGYGSSLPVENVELVADLLVELLVGPLGTEDHADVVDVLCVGNGRQLSGFYFDLEGLVVTYPIANVLHPRLHQKLRRHEALRQGRTQPSDRPFARCTFDDVQCVADHLALFVFWQVGEILGVGHPMTQYGPAQPGHLVDHGFLMNADLSIQRRRPFDPQPLHHLEKPPYPYPQAIVTPRVVDDVGF